MAGVLRASQGMKCWAPQVPLKVPSGLNPMSILGTLPIVDS